MKKVILLVLVLSMFNLALNPFVEAKANYGVTTENGKESSNVLYIEEYLFMTEDNIDNLNFINSENGEIINLEDYQLEEYLVAPYATGGTIVVAGIGVVVLVVVGGVIIGVTIGGILYYAGSWFYDAVQSYLNAETADEYISKNRKAGIRKEFPGEYLGETLNEIEKDAKAGKARARTAKKLLNDNRFKK